jgi:multicomponent Na+:H+ antiporter subunit D
MTPAVLTAFVAVPLVLGGLLVLLADRTRVTIAVFMTVLIASTAGGVWLVATQASGEPLAHSVGLWPFGIAIPFVADMFTALMLAATGLVSTVCCAFAMASGHAARRFFPALVLVLTAGVNGALLTADLFNLFVFIEVMLLASYGLLVMSAPGNGHVERIKGARLYVTVNLLASTILLAGVGFIYGVAGTVNLAELAGLAQESPPVAIAATVCLVAFAIKACVVPVHGWIMRTYPVTSPVVTALFSGLHTKVAIYAIYRVYAVVFEGDASYLWVGLVLFSVTMIVGGFGAVGETTMRSILTFSTVGQVGYILLGVALFGPLGLAAGIFYQVHHMIAKASLFLTTGAIELRYGTSTLGKIGGVAKREPWVAIAFFAAALSLAGLPPFSGFVAKLALVMAALEAGQVAVAGIAIGVGLLTLMAILKIWSEVFWGKTTPDDMDAGATDVASAATNPDSPAVALHPLISPALLAPGLALAFMTIALGVGGEFLLGLTEVAAAGLIDTTDYVEAVRGA